MKRTFPEERRRLGAAIRKRRVALGYSQERLAERIKCHRNYVGCIERGEQSVTFDMFARFAQALGCKMAVLFGEAGC